MPHLAEFAPPAKILTVVRVRAPEAVAARVVRVRSRPLEQLSPLRLRGV